MDIELVTGKNATIHDIAWHPRGNTALLVGEEGLAMRYDSYDHSVTNVNGSFSVLGKSLTTVIWRPGGDFAYVGAADGSVWKFAEHTGFERLENLGTSEVNDIACHRNYNVCFLATMDEGIAVIDEGHAVSWVGQTAAETWVGIDCADPALNECVGFASGLQSKVIRINTIDASKSSAQSAMRFDLPSGEQTAVTRGHDGTTLVHLAPLGLLRHTPPQRRGVFRSHSGRRCFMGCRCCGPQSFRCLGNGTSYRFHDHRIREHHLVFASGGRS